MVTSTESARVIVSYLYRAGVREAVLCPGSRNAPLSFALLALAEQGHLRLHVRIDERSAAFLALGLSLASKTPVPICVTSGTAVANIFPAIVEANYAQVPLIVLSANQPLAFSERGESQVIDQYGIFGDYVRYATHISETANREEIVLALEAGIASAISPSYPGPIQLDIGFIEPLMPSEDRTWNFNGEINVPVEPLASTVIHRPIDQTASVQDRELHMLPKTSKTVQQRAYVHKQAPRTISVDLSIPTVVVVGSAAWPDFTPQIPQALAEIPTVAEPTAVLPHNYLHPWAIPLVKPEQVIVIGRPTLHREVAGLINDPAVTTISLSDPHLWQGKPQAVSSYVDFITPVGQCSSQWLELCTKAHELTIEIITKKLAVCPQMTGLKIASIIGDIAHKYASILLGPSNPIRDIALTVGPLGSQVQVISNRGASGIDGNVATASGLSYINPPTLAFIGDLTFLHDINSLIVGPTESRPTSLTIVVANDCGGGIFTTLEQGDPIYNSQLYGSGAERIFFTPHGVSIADLCHGLGVEYHCVPDDGFKDDIIRTLLLQPCEGIRVVEVPCSRSVLREIHYSVKSDLQHSWDRK